MAEDVDLTLELYRSIADQAPVVEPEWQQLVLNLETASTVDPNDPASLQLAADTARASTAAATRVQEYTSQTCGLQIGQVPAITLPPTTVPDPAFGDLSHRIGGCKHKRGVGQWISLRFTITLSTSRILASSALNQWSRSVSVCIFPWSDRSGGR